MEFVSHAPSCRFKNITGLLTYVSELARLIGGSRATPTKKPANDHPQNRLAKFKRTWSQTLQAWHKFTGSKDAETVHGIPELISTNLQRLTSLLEDDTRAPHPHLCLSFAASSYVCTALARIAISLNNELVFRETLSIFTILVDNDEDALLSNDRFAQTLSLFADSVLAARPAGTLADLQAEVLELVFGIAAKIRLEPELLPAWFRPLEPASSAVLEKTDDADSDQEVAGFEQNDRSGKMDFPLFRQFVGHVYQDGRVGDFARTGLLYLFESASNSTVLETWIVDSDVPTLMASGLGALYSQLSRKLSIAHPKEGSPLILALSDNHHKQPSAEAESFFSLDLQSRLSTFISYLVFWQDVLKQCYSTDIKHTLIDHFYIFFLQQILYPSLLESSDVDGGSSVAVLTYLWAILNAIDHPDLIHMILDYLLALSEYTAPRPSTPRSPVVERRRQSILVRTQSEQQYDGMTPAFFNLIDLILASCRSNHSETVTATLRLISVILNKYHRYAVSSLVRVIPDLEPDVLRPVGAFNQDLNALIQIAKDIGGVDGMDAAYENSLRDGLVAIESHVCSGEMFSIGTDSFQQRPRIKKRRSSLAIDTRIMRRHNLDQQDPLFKLLLGLLETLFTNDIEVNLGLTNVITQLASCPYTRLEGWLVTDPVNTSSVPSREPEATKDMLGAEFLDQAGLEQERINAYKAARSSAKKMRDQASVPAFVQTLQYLANSLQVARANIDEFDSLLAGRKRAFQGVAEIENEMQEPPRAVFSPQSSSDQSKTVPGRSASPVRNIATQARSPSPRGRTLTAIAGVNKSPASSPKPSSSKKPSPLGSPLFKPQSRGPSRSPSKVPRPTSPLKLARNISDEPTSMDQFTSPNHSRHSSAAKSTVQEIFERKIRFPRRSSKSDESTSKRKLSPDEGVDDANAEADSSLPASAQTKETHYEEASLTHVLTNVVILQEFILEIAAIIHVRAGLLDSEIRFL